MRLVNDHLKSIRCELAAEPDLICFGLFSPRQLGQYARERGIPTLNADAVEVLWQTGLLRCDLIIAPQELHVDSLECVGEAGGRYFHCDLREVPHRTNGLGSVFEEAKDDLPDIELRFHPFRLYPLYHIVRALNFSPTATQYLLYRDGLQNLAGRHLDVLDTWSSSPQSTERIDDWNAGSELAICAEPVAYGQVFANGTVNCDERTLAEYRGKLAEQLAAITIGNIEGFRADICRAAEVLDSNKLLHIVVRLMAPHERLKLRGSVSGSMLFIYMAEMIRRVAEEALGTQLPEEDEMGFGEWMDGARAMLYGTDRILDAHLDQQRDFLRSMGLDRGVKVRCYVEGPTELGALRSAVGEGSDIQFVNLRGQVLEKQGKGLSFVESLWNDRESGVFSVVLLDGDREDFIRALRNDTPRV